MKKVELLLSLIQKKRQKITFTTIIQMMTLISGLNGTSTEFSKKPLDTRTSPGYNREDIREHGGIGRHEGFKTPCHYWRSGSIPDAPTTFAKGKQMRNIVMLTAALMMGCGEKEEDSASDTAVAEDTAE